MNDRSPPCLVDVGKPVELYNLDDDLGEQHDLAGEKPRLVKQLSEAWAQWEAEVNASAKECEP